MGRPCFESVFFMLHPAYGTKTSSTRQERILHKSFSVASRDVSVVLERVQCAAAEGVILDERIGRNALSAAWCSKAVL